MDGHYSPHSCCLLNSLCPSSFAHNSEVNNTTAELPAEHCCWHHKAKCNSLKHTPLGFSLHLGFLKLISDSHESNTMTMLTSVRYLQADAVQVPFTGSNSINAHHCWSAAYPATPVPRSFIWTFSTHCHITRHCQPWKTTWWFYLPPSILSITHWGANLDL